MDEERLEKLRAFLIHQRSRLTPNDVGLPGTGRRRVIGLRREEVAELAGVSNDWYRWFESGRPIRVSPPFLGRLAEALHLNPIDTTTLYHLALPELYHNDEHNLSFAHLGTLSPIEQGQELGPVLRQLAAAREAFLAHDESARSMVRWRVWHSWERSTQLGADPSRTDVPAAASTADALAERRDASRTLIEAAQPVLDSVKTTLYESPFVLVASDAHCCILDMWGKRDVLRQLSRINFEPGGDLSENACGTNAIGTAVLDQRPIQVLGSENFCEGGSDLTCTAAPIRDPETHTVIGVLDATAESRHVCPQMIGIITQAAIQIEERLAENSLAT